MDHTSESRFVIEWSARGSIKWVSIIDVETGRRSVGRDWADWDKAYRQAMHGIAPKNKAA